jgi:hypothetical protein
MTVFRNDNSKKSRGAPGAVLRSPYPSCGASRSGQIDVARLAPSGWWILLPAIRTGPDRTGDIIPEIASDERTSHREVYVVWQDARFNGFQRDEEESPLWWLGFEAQRRGCVM